jgi:hypothetical protein
MSWWYKISDSELFLKLRNPEAFRLMLNEIKLHKSFIGVNNNLIESVVITLVQIRF